MLPCSAQIGIILPAKYHDYLFINFQGSTAAYVPYQDAAVTRSDALNAVSFMYNDLEDSFCAGQNPAAEYQCNSLVNSLIFI